MRERDLFDDIDFYDKKRVLRRRRVKKAIIALATGAAVVFGVKHFNPNLKLPKLPEFAIEKDNDNKETEPAEKSPELVEEFGNQDYGEDIVILDAEDTGAKVVEHNIINRASSILLGYFLYDNDIQLPEHEEVKNIIDYMNGDYEVSTAEAEAMYNKLIDYYLLVLNSNNYMKLVNDNRSNNDKPFNVKLANIIITDQSINVFPLMERLDKLHMFILSAHNNSARVDAMLEFYNIIEGLYNGGYRYNDVVYQISDFNKKENIAAASLLEQYVLDIIPLIGYEKSEFLDNIFNDDRGFMGTWKQNLIDANTDGEYSYTIK